LIHGYASSGALMFQIAKQLIEHFCLITIDIIGMGASSRPDDYAKHSMTPE
jgi:pimeloyl-ACP methyl ester carboxylesterase